MAASATSTSPDDQELASVTPWVRLVVTDDRERPSAARAWEEAGFGVEVASSVENAFECLSVMTPALIVVDGKLYWPPPG